MIVIRDSSGKKRVIPKAKYEQMATAILSILAMEEEITVEALIDQINNNLVDTFSGELGWYFLKVKSELEWQGLIKTSFPRKYERLLKINRSAFRRSIFYSQKDHVL